MVPISNYSRKAFSAFTGTANSQLISPFTTRTDSKIKSWRMEQNWEGNNFSVRSSWRNGVICRLKCGECSNQRLLRKRNGSETKTTVIREGVKKADIERLYTLERLGFDGDLVLPRDTTCLTPLPYQRGKVGGDSSKRT